MTNSRRCRPFPLTIALTAALLLAASCVKDQLWYYRELAGWSAGRGITVTPDSVALLQDDDPRLGYLTLFRTAFYDNHDGDTVVVSRTATEMMHNVNVILTIVDGDPAMLAAVSCRFDGLASRASLPTRQLLPPSLSVGQPVAMDGRQGVAAFRVLGAAGQRVPLTVHLVQTDQQTAESVVDVSDIIGSLQPYPVDYAEATSENRVDVSVDINIELHVAHSPLRCTATLTNWINEGGNIDMK